MSKKPRGSKPAPDWWRAGFLPVPRAHLTASAARDPACHRWALVDLLGLASLGRDGELPRGTLDVTHRALARRWRWSVDSVRRLLAELEAGGIITVASGIGRRPTRVTFVEYDPPKTTAYSQALAAERQSIRPRHSYDGRHLPSTANSQGPVPVAFSGERPVLEVSRANSQTVTAQGESANARHTLFNTAATREVRGKASSERICKCGLVSLKPGDTECGTCRKKREAADYGRESRAFRMTDDMLDEYTVEVERKAIQEEPDGR